MWASQGAWEPETDLNGSTKDVVANRHTDRLGNGFYKATFDSFDQYSLPALKKRLAKLESHQIIPHGSTCSASHRSAI